MRLLKSNLSQIGELSLLKKLCCKLPLRKDVVIGAGDDCAVVRIAGDKNYDYLLKSDGVVEGVHFKSNTKPELIGHKALGRVLSDIAAMGGEPLWALINLVAPSKTPVKRIEKVYAGMNVLAKRFNLSIVGGDVSSGHELQLHVFGVGRVKKGKSMLRSGAKAGDAIFVTGALGGSIAGKHLSFMPRLCEGQWLLRKNFATAMIDISDGLLRDLGHIISADGVGARLMLDRIPMSAAARRCSCVIGRLTVVRPLRPPTTLRVAMRAGGRVFPQADPSRRSATATSSADHLYVRRKSVLGHALADGEDYELLFTVPERKIKSFVKAWQRNFKLACTQIGWITARKGDLEGIDSGGKVIELNEAGFEHFRKREAQSGKGT